MKTDLIPLLTIIGIIFGLIGGIAAFINAFDGYSHFPAIPKRKRMIMSLEIAGLGFLMSIIAVIFVFFLINTI